MTKQRVYDFDKQFAYSEEEAARVAEILKAKLGAERVVRATTEEDKGGVDYWAVLPSGKRLGVDVKRRRWDAGDFYAEVLSKVEEGYLGWALDPTKRTDYLLLLWPKRDLLISHPQLRATVIRRRADYERMYGTKDAKTRQGWTTRNIAVPLARLLTDMYGAIAWPFGTPLGEPRDCPSCLHKHPVGTTCAQCVQCEQVAA